MHPRRIDSLGGLARPLAFTVPAGKTLLDGIATPLNAAGLGAAALCFSGARVNPFRYVTPDRAPDATHVAYFSSPCAPAGITRIERANATFGHHMGKPFLHCHAAWVEADGQRRGGHVLNDETVLTEPLSVQAWGFAAARLETAEDAETNFTLFQIGGAAVANPNAVLARVRPNQDITLAVEAIARAHAMPEAVPRGGLGSLVGARFADGRTVSDDATEVLVTGGRVRRGVATLDMMVVDRTGRVHEGRLARGENSVCITFDLVLTRPD